MLEVQRLSKQYRRIPAIVTGLLFYADGVLKSSEEKGSYRSLSLYRDSVLGDVCLADVP